jgi:type IV pilus assembly protein PilC
MEKSFKDSIQEILDNLTAVTLVQKVFLTQNLELMLKSGIPLSRAFDALAEETTTNKLKKILLEIKEDVEKGSSLSSSLLLTHALFFNHPFPPPLIGPPTWTREA